MSNPIMIIGTGLAGYQLAKEFRKLDQTTPMTIVTADDGKFYSKPLLSTALTSGKTADMLPIATADMMAEQLKAAILTQQYVSAIDPIEKHITINNNKIFYSKLILACGADVIKPPIEGEASDEILFINHIYHYSEFRELLKNKKRIVILGAGLIGSEFANDLSNAGYEVHVIAPAKAPLDLLIPEEIGKLLQTALEENGVHFHLGCVATHIDKKNNLYHLNLSDGTALETELVLSAIGLKPHVALAHAVGAAVNRGIIVNRYLETSVTDIYALGDCAEVEGHVLPYITPLLNCSRALAKTLSGTKTAVDYSGMPIIVKTPAHPIVVCPPPKQIEGNWKIEKMNHSVRALFYSQENKLYGFVLTNEAVKERMNLVKEIPGLF
ncbi:MAG TPA: FAD-dependent oxidoreductase [Gammaproteobacteria bacterium]|nr:FAD-dependent oxidoreductase [Gammaproteobacteria bacterium]